MNEEKLFERALSVPEGDRSAFLERECPNPKLRARVHALLASDATSTASLDLPDTATFGKVPAGAAEVSPQMEAASTIIAGRYKLLQPIGEGGMGTVWMAEQTEPVKRRVALKLIRVERGSSATILARFEAERQAIALMDHPHIAKLFDAGTTASGWPFFVMELVKGVPLNEYCDAHRLSIPDRLNLFVQICGAVQHAHQKGIVHRDLKPSNILVESHDGQPVPKIIDFGLAKATSGLQLSEHSLFTAFGTVLGTPLYMAPEQASFNAIDVDTRADVYALGVILYELLTGTTPITRETLKVAALDEMLRLIREQEAPTPSSRLRSADSAPSVAASRQTEPQKLGRFVQGELDWIVMKALAKERDRRYETANGFAQDIERFLSHEPVQAGPPSASYRIRKFLQRQRGPVIAASLLLIALIAGITGTTLAMLEAGRQRDVAERRLQQTERGSELLDGVFTDIDPDAEAKGGPNLREQLAGRFAKAADQLDAEAIADKAVTSRLRLRLGVSLMAMGNASRAEALFRQALQDAPTAADAALLKMNIAQCLRITGSLAEATRLGQEAAAELTAELGPDHTEVLKAEVNLATFAYDRGDFAEQKKILDAAMPRLRRVLGEDHELTMTALANSAESLRVAGHGAEAVAMLEKLVALNEARHGSDHLQTLNERSRLANAHRIAGQLDLAISMHREVLEAQRAKLGPDHIQVAYQMGFLATSLQHAGQSDEALPIMRAALGRLETKLASDHADLMTHRIQLAEMLLDQGQTEEAVRELAAAFAQAQAKLGRDHFTTQGCAGRLGMAMVQDGDLTGGVPLLEATLAWESARGPILSGNGIGLIQSLAQARVKIGKGDEAIDLLKGHIDAATHAASADHTAVIQLREELAATLTQLKRPTEARAALVRLLEDQDRVLGPTSPDSLRTAFRLAVAAFDEGLEAEARPLFERVADSRTEDVTARHREALVAEGRIAYALKALGRDDEALKQLERLVPLLSRILGPGHSETLMQQRNLVLLLGPNGQSERAAQLAAEGLETLRKSRPADDPDRLEWTRMLAAERLRQNRAADAEPLYRELADAWEKLGNKTEYLRALDHWVFVLQKQRMTADLPMALERLTVARRAVLGPDDDRTREALMGAALCWHQAKRFEKAEPLYRELLVVADRKYPKDHLQRLDALDGLGYLLVDSGKFTEAEPLLRECLALRLKNQPENWMTAFDQTVLGECLLGQKQYTDAEPLLLAGQVGLVRTAKEIPPEYADFPRRATANLVRLYTATNQPDEVKKWQGEMGKFPVPKEQAAPRKDEEDDPA